MANSSSFAGLQQRGKSRTSQKTKGMQTAVSLHHAHDFWKLSLILWPMQEEMNKGYFDDFKELRQTEGRVISAPDRLVAAQAAPIFPSIQVIGSIQTQASLWHPHRFCQHSGVSHLHAYVSASRLAVGWGGSVSTWPPEVLLDLAVFLAPLLLMLHADAAVGWPVQVTIPGSQSLKTFPHDLLPGSRAALLTAGFRAGSEGMLQSWSAPFAEHFAQCQDVQLLDLALIDSVVSLH